MAPVFDIQIEAGTGIIEKGRFSILEDEWNRLLRFCKNATRLKAIRLFQTDFKYEVTLGWKQGVGATTRTKLPEDDDLSVLLHRLRPFVLQSEESYLPAVCNLLKRRIVLPSFRSTLDRYRDLFLGREFYSQIHILSNGTAINSEEVLMTWLNGFEYHQDQDKRAAIQELSQIFPLETTRGHFVGMIFDKVQAVQSLADLIEIMDARDGQSFRVGRFL